MVSYRIVYAYLSQRTVDGGNRQTSACMLAEMISNR